MIYYKEDSVPLEIIELEIGERGYDEYGNYIEIDAFGKSQVLKKTVLSEEVKIDSFESIRGLCSFWSYSRKIREGLIDEVQDSNPE